MSMTFARRPLTMISRRRGRACSCGCGGADVVAMASHPTNARSLTIPAPSHSGAETARGSHGDGLAHVSGGVHERDGAQHGGPGAARHHLRERLGSAAQAAVCRRPLDGVRLDPPLPILRREAANDLARAMADRVAILA